MITRTSLALALIASVAACGNDRKESASALGLAQKAVVGMIAQHKAKGTPAAPAPTPEQMAAEALSVNKGPLILIGVEAPGTNQVMAMTGDNNGMRTYMTKNEQSVILRRGMLVGTRGLGNDVSVSESPRAAALVLAGQGGQAQRVMRFYSGDGLERPLPFDCTVGRGPKPGVMVESCQGNGVSFQNSYIVSGGAVSVSRQWLGPALGYATIQELRR